jgi:two-component system, chemotaxis family, CheB/CheR fusion protein
VKPEKLKSTVSTIEKTSASDSRMFPIVGIGASAGGLDAFEQFLMNVPENTGMAYVIIQHLDPTQKGMLPELLQRITKMKVFQVKDRTTVKPDCVYVIPPNASMSILKGVLHLFEPIESRGMRLPIDFFFRSLGIDHKELAVGVILSGMGSDGSMGVRTIKENNGIVMVQEPTTATYNSMPLSGMDSVLVDIVASPRDMPTKLMEFMKRIPFIKSDIEIEVKDQSSLEKIIILLRDHTGNDFTFYKKNTLYRRIERRMGIHKIEKIASYVHFLIVNPKEVDILFKELLIGVTNFFRDSAVWEKMKESIFPDFFANPTTGTTLRAWIPGCSTGEEAYSLAIVFKEALEKFSPHGGISLQIFATDLDNDAIETARKGLFPIGIAADVSPDRLNRFFVSTDEGYRINAEIREMVVFAQQNIVMHPPFTKIDILTCRNLLIYMEPELQKKILGLFYYCINPEGIMILGSSESLGKQSNLFTPIDPKLRIFRRSKDVLSPELFDFPSSFSRTKMTNIEKLIPNSLAPNIQSLADQLLLQHFSPPGVLVNLDGDIVYISGRTGKYLEPAVGKANLNIFAMLREGLLNEFSIAFRKAILTKETVVLHHIKIGSNDSILTANVKIQWIAKPEPLKNMVMIIFTDVPTISGVKKGTRKGKITIDSVRHLKLEEELQHTREEMQSTLEEMQTSQEELKSTNEELQSTNEELQSTNEELTTSKEEMQSLNEELQTVNVELQSKVDEFSRVNNDMKNLLNSTDIATLFLDKELNIRRYTNQTTKIFKLIKSDIGRPFTDQASDLDYPELVDDAREVLRTLVFIQKQISTKDGRWFSIRIMPYRTFDDRIDGLVITFFNMSSQKQIEVQLNESIQMNRMLLNLSSDIIIKLSADLKVMEFNTEAEKFFNKKREAVLDLSFIQSFISEPEQKRTEKELKRLLNEVPDSKFRLKVLAAKDQIRQIEWLANVIFDNQKMSVGLILSSKNQ